MSRHFDTIAALATPAGTGALAVVRVTGSDTARLAQEITGIPPPPRVALHRDYRDRRGALIDDVLATYFAGPHSYTGEDALEISCHGSPFIAQKILEDLLARGCRPAGPGEFTQRAFLNGRMDLSQAEGVMDLIRARSDRALDVANRQLRGALGRRMAALTEELLAVTARVEAYIDFPEEDLPPEDRAIVARELERLLAATERLRATSHYGEMLRDGIRTVIVGEPNVGKSSLLNRLVGSDRALVSPEPGTTRDFIEERIVVGSHCLRLIDTAGLNPHPAPLEKLGIEKTHERLAEADLILAVLDSTRPDPGLSDGLAAAMRPDKSLIIFNKNDLSNSLPAPGGLPEGIETVRVSALTGSGIDQLVAIICARADSFQNDVGPDNVAINSRHARALQDAGDGLRRALEMLASGGATELVASDLRSTLAAYGEIVGKVDNERMLDHLFRMFCIGK